MTVFRMKCPVRVEKRSAHYLDLSAGVAPGTDQSRPRSGAAAPAAGRWAIT